MIKGGRVIDPGQRIDRVIDVAISKGRIAALQPDMPPPTRPTVVDARGKLVTAGLVDIHAHIDAEMPPAHCLSTGVTSLVDAGSRGADNVGELVALARAAPNRVRILLNLGRTGLGGRGELLDFANADAAAARRRSRRIATSIVGIKARLSERGRRARPRRHRSRARSDRAAEAAADGAHRADRRRRCRRSSRGCGPATSSRTCTRRRPTGSSTRTARVFPEVLEARQRGILFDIGNGRNGHITWEVAERAIQQGFLPDTISSDLTAPGRTDRVFDFPTVLSKFLLLGLLARSGRLPRDDQRRPRDRAVSRPRHAAVGAPADVAVFELRTASSSSSTT